MKSNPRAALAIAAAVMLGVATVAPADSLDIKPGLWKKSLKVVKGGRTEMDTTIDACLTASDLDLKKTAEKLTQSPSCKVTEQELSPKRLKVVIQCKDMQAESTTEVLSRESVAVTATMMSSADAEVTRSTEQWSFVKADCAK